MANGQPPMRTLDAGTVDRAMRGWHVSSVGIARNLVKKYGMPHEASTSSLIWHYSEPWEKTTIWRYGARHNFSKPHLDVLEQTILYRIPLEKVEELAAYNGSLVVNRTRGEITSRCNNEAVNFLAMNLAHEIILGLITPVEARERHREIMNGHRLLWPEPFMEGLQFQVIAQGYGVEESREKKSLPV